jgi:hypothetical protein
MTGLTIVEIFATRSDWWPRAMHFSFYPPSPAFIAIVLGALGLAALAVYYRWR